MRDMAAVSESVYQQAGGYCYLSCLSVHPLYFNRGGLLLVPILYFNVARG